MIRTFSPEYVMKLRNEAAKVKAIEDKLFLECCPLAQHQYVFSNNDKRLLGKRDKHLKTSILNKMRDFAERHPSAIAVSSKTMLKKDPEEAGRFYQTTRLAAWRATRFKNAALAERDPKDPKIQGLYYQDFVRRVNNLGARGDQRSPMPPLLSTYKPQRLSLEGRIPLYDKKLYKKIKVEAEEESDAEEDEISIILKKEQKVQQPKRVVQRKRKIKLPSIRQPLEKPKEERKFIPSICDWCAKDEEEKAAAALLHKKSKGFWRRSHDVEVQTDRGKMIVENLFTEDFGQEMTWGWADLSCVSVSSLSSSTSYEEDVVVEESEETLVDEEPWDPDKMTMEDIWKKVRRNKPGLPHIVHSMTSSSFSSWCKEISDKIHSLEYSAQEKTLSHQKKPFGEVFKPPPTETYPQWLLRPFQTVHTMSPKTLEMWCRKVNERIALLEKKLPPSAKPVSSDFNLQAAAELRAGSRRPSKRSLKVKSTPPSPPSEKTLSPEQEASAEQVHTVQSMSSVSLNEWCRNIRDRIRDIETSLSVPTNMAEECAVGTEDSVSQFDLVRYPKPKFIDFEASTPEAVTRDTSETGVPCFVMNTGPDRRPNVPRTVTSMTADSLDDWCQDIDDMLQCRPLKQKPLHKEIVFFPIPDYPETVKNYAHEEPDASAEILESEIVTNYAQEEQDTSAEILESKYQQVQQIRGKYPEREIKELDEVQKASAEILESEYQQVQKIRGKYPKREIKELDEVQKASAEILESEYQQVQQIRGKYPEREIKELDEVQKASAEILESEYQQVQKIRGKYPEREIKELDEVQKASAENLESEYQQVQKIRKEHPEREIKKLDKVQKAGIRKIIEKLIASAKEIVDNERLGIKEATSTTKERKKGKKASKVKPVGKKVAAQGVEAQNIEDIEKQFPEYETKTVESHETEKEYHEQERHDLDVQRKEAEIAFKKTDIAAEKEQEKQDEQQRSNEEVEDKEQAQDIMEVPETTREYPQQILEDEKPQEAEQEREIEETQEIEKGTENEENSKIDQNYSRGPEDVKTTKKMHQRATEEMSDSSVPGEEPTSSIVSNKSHSEEFELCPECKRLVLSRDIDMDYTPFFQEGQESCSTCKNPLEPSTAAANGMRGRCVEEIEPFTEKEYSDQHIDQLVETAAADEMEGKNEETEPFTEKEYSDQHIDKLVETAAADEMEGKNEETEPFTEKEYSDQHIDQSVETAAADEMEEKHEEEIEPFTEKKYSDQAIQTQEPENYAAKQQGKKDVNAQKVGEIQKGVEKEYPQVPSSVRDQTPTCSAVPAQLEYDYCPECNTFVPFSVTEMDYATFYASVVQEGLQLCCECKEFGIPDPVSIQQLSQMECQHTETAGYELNIPCECSNVLNCHECGCCAPFGTGQIPCSVAKRSYESFVPFIQQDQDLCSECQRLSVPETICRQESQEEEEFKEVKEIDTENIEEMPAVQAQEIKKQLSQMECQHTETAGYELNIPCECSNVLNCHECGCCAPFGTGQIPCSVAKRSYESFVPLIQQDQDLCSECQRLSVPETICRQESQEEEEFKEVKEIDTENIEEMPAVQAQEIKKKISKQESDSEALDEIEKKLTEPEMEVKQALETAAADEMEKHYVDETEEIEAQTMKDVITTDGPAAAEEQEDTEVPKVQEAEESQTGVEKQYPEQVEEVLKATESKVESSQEAQIKETTQVIKEEDAQKEAEISGQETVRGPPAAEEQKDIDVTKVQEAEESQTGVEEQYPEQAEEVLKATESKVESSQEAQIEETSQVIKEEDAQKEAEILGPQTVSEHPQAPESEEGTEKEYQGEEPSGVPEAISDYLKQVAEMEHIKDETEENCAPKADNISEGPKTVSEYYPKQVADTEGVREGAEKEYPQQDMESVEVPAQIADYPQQVAKTEEALKATESKDESLQEAQIEATTQGIKEEGAEVSSQQTFSDYPEAEKYTEPEMEVNKSLETAVADEMGKHYVDEKKEIEAQTMKDVITTDGPAAAEEQEDTEVPKVQEAEESQTGVEKQYPEQAEEVLKATESKVESSQEAQIEETSQVKKEEDAQKEAEILGPQTVSEHPQAPEGEEGTEKEYQGEEPSGVPEAISDYLKQVAEMEHIKDETEENYVPEADNISEGPKTVSEYYPEQIADTEGIQERAKKEYPQQAMEAVEVPAQIADYPQQVAKTEKIKEEVEEKNMQQAKEGVEVSDKISEHPQPLDELKNIKAETEEKYAQEKADVLEGPSTISKYPEQVADTEGIQKGAEKEYQQAMEAVEVPAQIADYPQQVAKTEKIKEEVEEKNMQQAREGVEVSDKISEHPQPLDELKNIKAETEEKYAQETANVLEGPRTVSKYPEQVVAQEKDHPLQSGQGVDVPDQISDYPQQVDHTEGIKEGKEEKYAQAVPEVLVAPETVSEHPQQAAETEKIQKEEEKKYLQKGMEQEVPEAISDDVQIVAKDEIKEEGGKEYTQQARADVEDPEKLSEYPQVTQVEENLKGIQSKSKEKTGEVLDVPETQNLQDLKGSDTISKYPQEVEEAENFQKIAEKEYPLQAKHDVEVVESDYPQVAEVKDIKQEVEKEYTQQARKGVDVPETVSNYPQQVDESESIKGEAEEKDTKEAAEVPKVPKTISKDQQEAEIAQIKKRTEYGQEEAEVLESPETVKEYPQQVVEPRLTEKEYQQATQDVTVPEPVSEYSQNVVSIDELKKGEKTEHTQQIMDAVEMQEIVSDYPQQVADVENIKEGIEKEYTQQDRKGVEVPETIRESPQQVAEIDKMKEEAEKEYPIQPRQVMEVPETISEYQPQVAEPKQTQGVVEKEYPEQARETSEVLQTKYPHQATEVNDETEKEFQEQDTDRLYVQETVSEYPKQIADIKEAHEVKEEYSQEAEKVPEVPESVSQSSEQGSELEQAVKAVEVTKIIDRLPPKVTEADIDEIKTKQAQETIAADAMKKEFSKQEIYGEEFTDANAPDAAVVQKIKQDIVKEDAEIIKAEEWQRVRKGQEDTSDKITKRYSQQELDVVGIKPMGKVSIEQEYEAVEVKDIEKQFPKQEIKTMPVKETTQKSIQQECNAVVDDKPMYKIVTKQALKTVSGEQLKVEYIQEVSEDVEVTYTTPICPQEVTVMETICTVGKYSLLPEEAETVKEITKRRIKHKTETFDAVEITQTYSDQVQEITLKDPEAIEFAQKEIFTPKNEDKVKIFQEPTKDAYKKEEKPETYKEFHKINLFHKEQDREFTSVCDWPVLAVPCSPEPPHEIAKREGKLKSFQEQTKDGYEKDGKQNTHKGTCEKDSFRKEQNREFVTVSEWSALTVHGLTEPHKITMKREEKVKIVPKQIKDGYEEKEEKPETYKETCEIVLFHKQQNREFTSVCEWPVLAVLCTTEPHEQIMKDGYEEKEEKPETYKETCKINLFYKEQDREFSSVCEWPVLAAPCTTPKSFQEQTNDGYEEKEEKPETYKETCKINLFHKQQNREFTSVCEWPVLAVPCTTEPHEQIMKSEEKVKTFQEQIKDDYQEKGKKPESYKETCQIVLFRKEQNREFTSVCEWPVFSVFCTTEQPYETVKRKEKVKAFQEPTKYDYEVEKLDLYKETCEIVSFAKEQKLEFVTVSDWSVLTMHGPTDPHKVTVKREEKVKIFPKQTNDGYEEDKEKQKTYKESCKNAVFHKEKDREFTSVCDWPVLAMPCASEPPHEIVKRGVTSPRNLIPSETDFFSLIQDRFYKELRTPSESSTEILSQKDLLDTIQAQEMDSFLTDDEIFCADCKSLVPLMTQYAEGFKEIREAELKYTSLFPSFFQEDPELCSECKEYYHPAHVSTQEPPQMTDHLDAYLEKAMMNVDVKETEKPSLFDSLFEDDLQLSSAFREYCMSAPQQTVCEEVYLEQSLVNVDGEEMKKVTVKKITKQAPGTLAFEQNEKEYSNTQNNYASFASFLKENNREFSSVCEWPVVSALSRTSVSETDIQKKQNVEGLIDSIQIQEKTVLGAAETMTTLLPPAQPLKRQNQEMNVTFESSSIATSLELGEIPPEITSFFADDEASGSEKEDKQDRHKIIKTHKRATYTSENAESSSSSEHLTVESSDRPRRLMKKFSDDNKSAFQNYQSCEIVFKEKSREFTSVCTWPISSTPFSPKQVAPTVEVTESESFFLRQSAEDEVRETKKEYSLSKNDYHEFRFSGTTKHLPVPPKTEEGEETVKTLETTEVKDGGHTDDVTQVTEDIDILSLVLTEMSAELEGPDSDMLSNENNSLCPLCQSLEFSDTECTSASLLLQEELAVCSCRNEEANENPQRKACSPPSLPTTSQQPLNSPRHETGTEDNVITSLPKEVNQL